jgi:hypothetical protein
VDGPEGWLFSTGLDGARFTVAYHRRCAEEVQHAHRRVRAVRMSAAGTTFEERVATVRARAQYMGINTAVGRLSANA